MHKRLRNVILCHPAKLDAPESLFTYCGVEALRDSLTVFKYGSLYSAASPCTTLNPKAFMSQGIRLQQSHRFGSFVKDVFYACEQVVGKVVTSFVQMCELYKLCMRRFEYAVNCVLSVRSLLAASNQAMVVYAHTQNITFKVFNSPFYTLPTGPTNTNNLIKGNL